jgi:hypothetical protein
MQCLFKTPEIIKAIQSLIFGSNPIMNDKQSGNLPFLLYRLARIDKWAPFNSFNLFK